MNTPTRTPDAVLVSYPWGKTPTARTPRVSMDLHGIPAISDSAGTLTLRFCAEPDAREYRLTLSREAAQIIARALQTALDRNPATP